MGGLFGQSAQRIPLERMTPAMDPLPDEAATRPLERRFGLWSATAQPSMDCGPPSADISTGMVMNGPMPIMFDMLSAVACSKPKRRCKCGGCAVSVEVSGFMAVRINDESFYSMEPV